MSKLRAAQKFGKELIDKANLATGLKVTKPGPATSRRVRKRGRNVNVAAGTAATGSVTAAATTRGTRKQQQKKGVKGDQAKDRSQQRKEQTMQRESALKRDREKTAQQTKTKKYNVGVSKGGVPFKEAFGYYRGKGQSEFTWNGKKYTTKLASGKTPTPASADASKADDSKKSVTRRGSSRRMSQRKFAGGGMMKAKGMAKGGKMKKKGYAMGGAAMKKKGYKKGGAAGKFPDLTGDGKVTQKDILKGRGVPGFSKGGMVLEVLKDLMTMGARAAEKKHGRGAVSKAKKELNRISGLTPKKTPKTEKQKKLAAADQRADYLKMTDPTPAAKKQRQVKQTERRIEKMEAGKFMGGGSVKKKGMAKGGAMKKKGYAKGGMTKKGYAKGGAAMKSKGASKGGVRRGKPRGVGAALRGYGKALR